MADRLAADPVVQLDARVAEARLAFARDVDALLNKLQTRADPRQLYGELRIALLEKFTHRIGFHSAADPVLLQLVREAYEHFADPESSVDVRDWMRAAAPFIAPAADGVRRR